ncbi:MAG: GNAT family N-acetyltransferase [Bacteroidetes bacterium]|nr:GNAT family N-acetyltransferase [Bacteroidota bacterium]
MAYTFIKTDSTSSDYQNLVTLLDAELKIRDGDEHPFFAQYNKSDMIKHVVVCYENETAVGCGAFKYYESGIVEIKRMFVLNQMRGKGIAKKILAELEQWAKELNYNQTILETGIRQPLDLLPCISAQGYCVISNYGQYENEIQAVFA